MHTAIKAQLTNNQLRILFQIQTFNLYQNKFPTFDQLKGLFRISSERLKSELTQMTSYGLVDATDQDFDDLRLIRNSTIKIQGESMVRLPVIGEKILRRRKAHPLQLQNEFARYSKSLPNGLHFAMELSDDYEGLLNCDSVGRYGSFLVARQQSFAENGNIVVAMYNEELLVRKLSMAGEYSELVSENHRSICISPNVSFRILGVVVGFRRHRG